jgi:hypothetical protein
MNKPLETDTREHNLIKKLKETPGSRKMAINAKCFECLGGTEKYMPDPGWKEAIRGCSSYGCPLREFRPYK